MVPGKMGEDGRPIIYALSDEGDVYIPPMARSKHCETEHLWRLAAVQGILSWLKVVFMAVGGMPMRCFTVLGPSQTGKSTVVEKLGSLEGRRENPAPLMD